MSEQRIVLEWAASDEPGLWFVTSPSLPSGVRARVRSIGNWTDSKMHLTIGGDSFTVEGSKTVEAMIDCWVRGYDACKEKRA